jgi:putative transposase
MQPAFQLKDATYHIVHKSGNGQPCFFADADYRVYLSCIKAVAENNFCEIHAYVLMPHYVQLLMTGHKIGAMQRVIANISKRHAQHVNYLYGHAGCVWEPRAKASPVLDLQSILKCYRFIELHPVRMGCVEQPDQYPWSSYLVNALGFASDLIKEHPACLALGTDSDHRRSAYRKVCAEDLGDEELEEINDALIQGRAIAACFAKATTSVPL